MPRLSYEEEEKKREQAARLIDGFALQTDKLVYLSPAVLASIAEQRGFDIDRQYFIRRYEELGIIYENGIWVKKIK